VGGWEKVRARKLRKGGGEKERNVRNMLTFNHLTIINNNNNNKKSMFFFKKKFKLLFSRH